jgi:hypothetical protein
MGEDAAEEAVNAVTATAEAPPAMQGVVVAAQQPFRIPFIAKVIICMLVAALIICAIVFAIDLNLLSPKPPAKVPPGLEKRILKSDLLLCVELAWATGDITEEEAARYKQLITEHIDELFAAYKSDAAFAKAFGETENAPKIILEAAERAFTPLNRNPTIIDGTMV